MVRFQPHLHSHVQADNGRPQDGHLEASVLTWCPQSGHGLSFSISQRNDSKNPGWRDSTGARCWGGSPGATGPHGPVLIRGMCGIVLLYYRATGREQPR